MKRGTQPNRSPRHPARLMRTASGERVMLGDLGRPPHRPGDSSLLRLPALSRLPAADVRTPPRGGGSRRCRARRLRRSRLPGTVADGGEGRSIPALGRSRPPRLPSARASPPMVGGAQSAWLVELRPRARAGQPPRAASSSPTSCPAWPYSPGTLGQCGSTEAAPSATTRASSGCSPGSRWRPSAEQAWCLRSRRLPGPIAVFDGNDLSNRAKATRGRRDSAVN